MYQQCWLEEGQISVKQNNIKYVLAKAINSKTLIQVV